MHHKVKFLPPGSPAARLFVRGLTLELGVVATLTTAGCGIPPSPAGYPPMNEGVSEVVVVGSSLSQVQAALEADGFFVSSFDPSEGSFQMGPSAPMGLPAMRISADRQGELLVLHGEYLFVDKVQPNEPPTQTWTSVGWKGDVRARRALLHLIDMMREIPGASVSVR